jgi:hypothetical protein
MVSLKSRVNGMLRLLLPSLVIPPVGQRGVYIALLALFGSAGQQQDDKGLAVFAEVNPVTG